MGTPRILIDTGAIFAFVTRTDTHHEAAKRFVREWLDQEGVFVLLERAEGVKRDQSSGGWQPHRTQRPRA